MGESERERLDRNLEQLMTELRVAMPGVQILFAFLLSVPFTQRFADVTDFQRDVYLVSIVSAGVATGFLIAPTAYHRMTFRRGEKRHLVFTANSWVIDRTARARRCRWSPRCCSSATSSSTRRWRRSSRSGWARLYIGLWFVFPLMRRLPLGDRG